MSTRISNQGKGKKLKNTVEFMHSDLEGIPLSLFPSPCSRRIVSTFSGSICSYALALGYSEYLVEPITTPTNMRSMLASRAYDSLVIRRMDRADASVSKASSNLTSGRDDKPSKWSTTVCGVAIESKLDKDIVAFLWWDAEALEIWLYVCLSRLP